MNHILYYPITATPFKRDNTYREITPCQALFPYVRCYWGSEHPYLYEKVSEKPEVVIPDTCVDIVYHIDYTDNKVYSAFCGINDKSFYSCDGGKPGHLVSTFSIRLYSWSAYMFSEDSMKSTLNGAYEVRSRFSWLDKELNSRLFEMNSLQEIVCFIEQLLIKKSAGSRQNEIINGTITNILLHKGSSEVSQLAEDAFVSSRQLERLFHDYIGITPKKLSNLIRYQFLWRDILFKRDFDILNAIYEYGYVDQPHLLHEFRRYHSMNISEARAVAFCDVGNIQENCRNIM